MFTSDLYMTRSSGFNLQQSLNARDEKKKSKND